MAGFGAGSSDSFEVYTANITPENHDLNFKHKIPIPTIRLTQATPSDTSMPSIIAPKASPRKKVVPRKGKLALLTVKTASSREKDLSDVVRRVNASTSNLDGNATCNVTVNGGTTMKMKDLLKFKDRGSRSTIDIYVDPANDPDIGEIVVVKKKKSRAKLDGLFENKGNLNVKEEERGEGKWWSIRGRKKERPRNDSLNVLKANMPEPNTVVPEARQRCGSTPLSPPDSRHTSSIALRAMKSIARIGSWAQLKNGNVTHDIRQYDSHPPEPRVKSSISSFEIGALSTHTGEDLTNRFSPIASLGRGQPPAQYRFLNPSITNTNVRQRTSSSGTLLSINSPTTYLQPYDHRRSSTSSSSGESNRPGSTYTASGEDTSAWGISAKVSTTKSKKGMSIKWGSVSSALALANGKRKSEEQSAEAGKGKTSKSNKKSKADKTKRPSENHKENVFPKDKEALSKGSHRHTMEGRKRIPVMSIFPGLNFGRSTTDITAPAPKSSMPPIAEDSNRSGAMDFIPENMRQHNRREVVTSEGVHKVDCELSDSDSDLWNKSGMPDEEVCIRLSVTIPPDKRSIPASAAKCNASSVADGLPPRPRLRSRPVSEQLLTSSQPSRPVGMILDVDINDVGFGNKEDVVALSVLEAANSDLASLINRLDLEATPDKDRNVTISSYVETIAAWRATGATVTQGLAPAFHVEHKEVHQSLLNGPHSLGLRNSVFGEKNALSGRDKPETFKLTYHDPIAFLDPTSNSNIDPSGSVMGESFAFVNSIDGIPPEESPLRRIGKIRAMTRAVGTATNMAGATMSKRFSAISATTRASVTSLRPYAYTTLRDKGKDKDGKQPIEGVFDSMVAPETVSNRASSLSKSPEAEQVTVIPRQQITSECGLEKQTGFSYRPSRVTGSKPCSTDDDSDVLPSGQLRVGSSQVSRTSSTTSTFGTGTALAKLHEKQLEKSKTGPSVSEPQQIQIGDPSSRMFEVKQKQFKYTLPSIKSADGSPVSLCPNRFGIEDTPTRPDRNGSHVRQNSTLIPIVHKPVSHGINVKGKVKHIELLTRSEREREDKERQEIARRGVLKQTARTNRASTSSFGSLSSTSSYSPLFGRGSKRLSVSPTPIDNATRRKLESRSTMDFANDKDESIYGELNSDIPNELKNVLSGNRRFLDVFSFLPTQNTSSTVISPSTSFRSSFPPSPGLPPTSPLPIPTSQSIILPTSTSTRNSSIVMEPSPPAPSLLPFIDPSPSPDPPSSIFAFTVVPPQNQQTLSEDGDIDEPISRAVSRTGLSISGSGSDDDTKQSFDFTGELKRLNESGGSHRRSFVEQLDAAFRTPAHVDVRGGLCSKGGITDRPISPLPPLPTLNTQLDAETEEGLSLMMESLNESMNNLGVEVHPSPQLHQGMMVKPSYGRLDTAFKFGGRSQLALTRSGEMPLDSSIVRELPGVVTLSTSPSLELRSLLSRRPVSLSTTPVNEHSSVSHSIYARAPVNDMSQFMETYMSDLADNNETPQVSPCSLDLESDTSSKHRLRIDTTRTEKAQLPVHARQPSDASFSGLPSFAAVRTKFEFGPDRPGFYSSLHLSQISIPKSHLRHESLFSLASVSSYGEVIKPGSNDPFNYADLAVEVDKEARDEFPRSDSIEDTKYRKRFSGDSDISSFYFKPGGHAPNQSIVSTNSMNAPPISLYNRSLGHRRNDSGGSMSSVAAAYTTQGANGGRTAWMRHQREQSIDSAVSDFSAIRLGRPGVGDKMFESIADHYPLTSISASPPESVSGDLAQKSSYDSILDEERRSTVDSIFDNTGHRSSISSNSVFWHDPTNEDERQPHDVIRRNLFPPSNFFRPLSIISNGNPGTPREDDTMITMLGGEHVRRRSLGSSFEASPCFRVEKQKREFGQDYVHICGHGTDGADDALVDSASPTAKIMGGGVSLIHKESVASAKSNKFGEARMNLARNGLLHRESLEDNCLSAEGEENLSMISSRSNGFSKPPPRRRQRKPTVTISHPPETTPPLSSSEGSGESQSSIDVERLTVLLQTAAAGTRSSASRVRPGTRIRAPGQGHRRRASQVSRGSMIGTIQEEMVPNVSPRPVVVSEDDTGKVRRDSLEGYPLEPLQLKMANLNVVSEPCIVEVQEWDEERWVIGLRRYYALRNEAYEEITHSRLVWPDTPFSLHALQTFVPPRAPVAMQALLEHSQKSYVPLPADGHPCRVRSRASSISRPALRYCPGSSDGGSTKSKKSHSRSRSRSNTDISISSSSTSSRALQSKNMNISTSSPVRMLAAFTPFSPLTINLGYDKDPSTEESFLTFAAIDSTAKERIEPLIVIKPSVRPRVPSEARRTALGWSKRKAPKNNEEGESSNKENEARGLLTSPSESLRIVRPRPRSRVIVNAAPRSTALLWS